jgi:hypothetical protein
MKPAKSATQSPAAVLRDLIVTYFNEDEVRGLAFDLGIDYETLSGTSKIGRSGGLVQQAARNGKIVDLVELCRKNRPEADWNDVGVAAATNPQQFLFVPDHQPLLNAAPDRALKLGAALGIIATLLLGCGFGGGLLAGQVVNVTINPVQSDRSSLESVPFTIGNREITPSSAGVSFEELASSIASGGLPAGTPVAITLDNVQATTLAEDAVSASTNSPIDEPHIRFVGNGLITANFRAKALGGRRVALEYTVRAERGRLILTPKSGWFNVVEIPGTTFGWVPLPGAVTDVATQWAQAQLDRSARWLRFEQVEVTPDMMRVSARAR